MPPATPTPSPAFTGVVLTGGASRRMGADKAFVDFRGRPLAAVARDALLRAGATEVVAVGGDSDRLAGLGLRPVPDQAPGEGPLGGIVSGLAAVSTDVAMILACDLVAIDAATVRRLLDALAVSGADVAVPVADGRRQVLAGAWARRALPVLSAAFDGGERAPRRVLPALRVREVRGVAPGSLVDVDWPADLARYAHR